ncbi:MAG: efflux RND transporter periplasmic adaptor subunit [Planctomycetaceae bacterium]|jgi:multidrug resistance efflux pump|nr:efflux RND transporter periplasmic adaptor subunit [Planctomycetaceae bacterium]
MKRSGFVIWIFVIAFLVIAAACGVAAYAWHTWNSGPVIDSSVLYAPVKRGYFLHEVTERGSIDSASNVEARCQVESPNGTMIIWVIPEGTHVKKGDLLCELDSSNLKEKMTQQQITVANSLSKMTQSEANLKVAELAYEEYDKGLFPQERITIENKISKANEEFRQAENNVRFTKQLLDHEYVTDIQLSADEETRNQKLNDKRIAELELDVLKKYTAQKQLIKLKADVDTAAIQFESDKKSHGLDNDRLEYYQKQLDACYVIAPEDGQVVYATHPWRRDEVIKEGTLVRDRQTIIKLPDPNQMQVKGYVNESSVSLVKVGQRAKIELEAMSGRTFTGEVKQVNDYPEPDSFFGSAVKEYLTLVSINDVSPSEKSLIRSGLTAKVKIIVHEQNDVLMVPVQCLFEYAGKIYAITYTNGVWDKKEVQVGITNNEVAVITSGLNEGEQVVMGAWKYREKVELPMLLEGQQTRQFGVSSVDKKDKEKSEDSPDAAQQNFEQSPVPLSEFSEPVVSENGEAASHETAKPEGDTVPARDGPRGGVSRDADAASAERRPQQSSSSSPARPRPGRLPGSPGGRPPGGPR